MADPRNIHTVSTAQAPAAIGPYAQGVVAQNFLFISGQIPLDPQTGEMVDGGIEDQTHRVIQNLRAVARAAGADLEHVVKTTIYLADMHDFPAVNQVYAEYFQSSLPARATVQVAALPRDAAVEIEAVALLP